MPRTAAATRKIPLYLHIAYLFVGLLLSFAAISSAYQFYQERQMMLKGAEQQFAQVQSRAAVELEALYRPTIASVTLLAHGRLSQARSLEQRLVALPALTMALNSQPALTALYMGYANGEFFFIRRWNDETALQALFEPPAGTRWIVQSVALNQGQLRGEYLYFNAELKLLEQRAKPDYRFDPRGRSWYKNAQSQQGLYVTNPYLFFSSKQSGVSFAFPAPGGVGVAGADITLDSLSDVLASLKITPDSRLALLNPKGELVSWERGTPKLVDESGNLRLPKLDDLKAPVFQALERQFNQRQGSQQAFVALGNTWQGARLTLPTVGGQGLTLLLATPHDELLADVIKMRNQGLLMALGLLLLGIVLALWLARLASRPLQALIDEAAKIERFDFREPIDVHSNIAEVANLARAMRNMKATIQRFLELSVALSSESNFNNLLAQLLGEMQELTNAEAALIYLADGDGRRLHLARARNAVQLIEGDQSEPLDLLNLHHHPLVQSMEQGEPRPLSRVELKSYFPQLTQLDKDLSLWALPLRNRSGDLLGVLTLLVNEQHYPLKPELRAFVQEIAATSAVALNTQRLLDEQKQLLEAFIQLIAGAIDAKSPYTGGHCQRVPVLTKQLAQAACAQKSGPFADFDLTEQQWEELHIAAWLHDCGKVTTPEYVVDKATKLETLYDRIHEIRMRFELIKREAEVACWQAVAQGASAEQQLQRLSEQWRILDDEFAFVARCNQGGESMSEADLDRLQQIAQRTWQRTLSDRLGLSYEELERKKATAEPSLPTTEQLLADKPEHLFARSLREQMPANNPWGFKLKVPAVLYNRGELYNLSIRRGTLSEEERYKINEHIVQTIIMLEKLPFPRHLRQVPEIAGGHHEKMDGTGYPRRLLREQMSVPARMMAIADIFEALTAIDRPYKKGKTLSEALQIMAKMRDEQHIDAELFALFVDEGIYLDYAKTHMRPEQIDAPDLAALMR